MVSSLESTTCLTLIQATDKTLLIAQELRYLSTFLVFTTMITLEILVQAMLKENQITFRSASSLVSRFLDNGKQTGIKDIKCQLSTIYFRARIIHKSIRLKSISCMPMTSHSPKITKSKSYFQKERKILNLNQLAQSNQIPLKRASSSAHLTTSEDQQSLSRKAMLFTKSVIAH